MPRHGYETSPQPSGRLRRLRCLMANFGRRLFQFAAFILPCLVVPNLFADAARFDLTGPKVEVRVTRNGKTLPIAAVPNLQPGDKIWLHPDLPPTQSVHYLLIAVFLRGTTNPRPTTGSPVSKPGTRRSGKRAFSSPYPRKPSRRSSSSHPRPEATSAPFVPPYADVPESSFAPLRISLKQASNKVVSNDTLPR